MWAEWAVLIYLVLTLLIMFFGITKLPHFDEMLKGRLQVIAITAALWATYRMWPCRLLLLVRITAQLTLLSWWYTDTYYLNQLFPNFDHLFATLEQQLLGFQPALVFAQQCPWPVVSELMHMGYMSYFPLIALVTMFYFHWRYEEFQRTSFIILAGFFCYYVVFILLPVTGPQYYYPAVGFDQIARGIFPDLGNYFVTHAERVTLPGWSDGLFYQLVDNMHSEGERPTAAFPSSHVGITTILLMLAWRTGSRRLVLIVLFFLILMCFATVYIMAHYLIDVVAGWLSAVLLYCLLSAAWILKK